MLPTAVLSCHFTQFLQYNHRPLLTTFFPSSLLWPSHQALCPRLHYTCLRSSNHCDAHRGRRSLLLKFLVLTFRDESWKQTFLRVALLRKVIPKLYCHETLDATFLVKPTTCSPNTSPPSWARLLFRTRTLTVYHGSELLLSGWRTILQACSL